MDVPWPAPLGPTRTWTPLPDAQDLLLMLRPERVRLVTGEALADDNTFPAEVSDLVYQGESYMLYARLGDGSEIAVRGAVREATFAGLPRPGERVSLALDRADTVIIADGGA